jgi:hypothetical protein
MNHNTTISFVLSAENISKVDFFNKVEKMGKIITEWGKYYKGEYLFFGNQIDQLSFENKFQDLLKYIQDVTIENDSEEIIFKKPCDFIVKESEINDLESNDIEFWNSIELISPYEDYVSHLRIQVNLNQFQVADIIGSDIIDSDFSELGLSLIEAADSSGDYEEISI